MENEVVVNEVVVNDVVIDCICCGMYYKTRSDVMCLGWQLFRSIYLT